MQISQKEREQIYLEEKEKRESSHSSFPILFFLTIGSIIGIIGVAALVSKSANKKVSLDDLRRAYPGLDPDEER